MSWRLRDSIFTMIGYGLASHLLFPDLSFGTAFSIALVLGFVTGLIVAAVRRRT